jgi:hypothetical protein
LDIRSRRAGYFGPKLNKEKEKHFASYIDEQVSEFSSPWHIIEKEKFLLILESYH